MTWDLALMVKTYVLLELERLCLFFQLGDQPWIPQAEHVGKNAAGLFVHDTYPLKS